MALPINPMGQARRCWQALLRACTTCWGARSWLTALKIKTRSSPATAGPVCLQLLLRSIFLSDLGEAKRDRPGDVEPVSWADPQVPMPPKSIALSLLNCLAIFRLGLMLDCPSLAVCPATTVGASSSSQRQTAAAPPGWQPFNDDNLNVETEEVFEL
ncbi:kelch-like protein 40b [Lates japonicus]|uniref:Kelch-like protein 40b n=1 Tax=Lates japonicus TaxID=270547 RepID=A0AAD3MJK0_LATJO|nr:kelch-like protein 40b [Lates japonicus]